MSYLHEFNDPHLSQQILAKTHKLKNRPSISSSIMNMMEVCGSHTMSIYKNGIDQLLPPFVELLSGPGCPVCVTDASYIDQAILLAASPKVILVTFGDLLKVPGSHTSLSTTRANGGDIRVVYSPLDCIHLAKKHPEHEIVFLGIGFETTAPSIALALKAAIKMCISNLSFLISLKTMPSAIDYLLSDNNVNIDGLICPGHVAAIIGATPFEILAKKHGIPMVIAGFSCVDLSHSIYTLMEMIVSNHTYCKNLYTRVVKPNGNPNALMLLDEVFDSRDSFWRGFGILPNTGLHLKDSFKHFDAKIKFKLNLKPVTPKTACICDQILKGIKKPPECPLYKTQCNPSHPVGACMVSDEGTCMNFYKYHN